MIDVLVVDDTDHDRDALRRFVERGLVLDIDEITVREATTCADALSRVEEKQPDCVFIDYNLPDDDGVTFCRRMSEHLASDYIPIILVTGQGSETIAADALRAGASDYLVKDELSRTSVRQAVLRAIEKVKLARELDAYRYALERSNEDLSLFATRLAHDLRNPIGIIGGYAELIGQKVGGGDVRTANYLADLRHALARIDAMIESLHQLSMVDVRDLTLEEVNLNGTVAAAVSNLSHKIDAHTATVDVKQPLPTVCGNDGLLQILFQNLIGNALKHSGTAQVTVGISAEEKNGVVTVRVEDNGVGIPPGDEERVFDMLDRGSNGAERSGFGIGLATCRRIVERHGGKIWCEPSEAGGCAFTFTLMLDD